MGDDWISVDNQYPHHGEEVWVLVEYAGCSNIHKDEYIGDGEWGEFVSTCVTHWMPIKDTEGEDNDFFMIDACVARDHARKVYMNVLFDEKKRVAKYITDSCNSGDFSTSVIIDQRCIENIKEFLEGYGYDVSFDMPENVIFISW